MENEPDWAEINNDFNNYKDGLQRIYDSHIDQFGDVAGTEVFIEFLKNEFEILHTQLAYYKRMNKKIPDFYEDLLRATYLKIARVEFLIFELGASFEPDDPQVFEYNGENF